MSTDIKQSSDSESEADNSLIGKILNRMKSEFNKTKATDDVKTTSENGQHLENPEKDTTIKIESETNGSENKNDLVNDVKSTENKLKNSDEMDTSNESEVNETLSELNDNENSIGENSIEVPIEETKEENKSVENLDVKLESTEIANGTFKKNEHRHKVSEKKIVREFTKNPSSRRSLRNKTQTESSLAMSTPELKRSSRRLSKDCGESVLQNAIARKEKSYNETAKPQRLSRRLKPTAKILANLEMCIKNNNFKNRRLSKDSTHSTGNDKSKTSEEENETERKTNETASESNEEDSITPVETPEKKPSLNIGNEKTKNKSLKCSKASPKKIKLDLSSLKEELSEPNSVITSPEIIENDNRSTRSKSFSSTSSISETRRSFRKRNESDADKEISAAQINERRRSNRHCAPTNSGEQNDKQSADSDLEMIQPVLSTNCLCRQRTHIRMKFDDDDDSKFCTAIDLLDSRGMGCNNPIETNEVRRPSQRVPYLMLCKTHLQRLIRHNCCPACGMFCTQGRFIMCKNGHQYHRNCLFLLNNQEEITNCCLHCGSEENQREVHIRMKCESKPAFIPFQRMHFPSAKMSIDKSLNGFNDYRSNALTMGPIDDLHIEDVLGNGIKENNKFVYPEMLYETSEKGNEKELISFIKQGADVSQNFDTHDGDTALHVASMAGHLKAVNILLAAGAPIDAFNASQKTPLMVAILAQQDHIVNYLVKSGASTTLKGTDGMTALHLAAKIGYKVGCEILIWSPNIGKSIIDDKDDGGWTPLVWACEHAHSEVAKYLLWRGADPHVRDLEQNVPLHWASYGGNHDIVQMLIDAGCNVNAINAHQDSPLHIAARMDRLDCVIALLAHNAVPDGRNADGDTPLDCAPSVDCSDSCRNAIALNVQLHHLLPPAQQYILTNDISNGKELNPIQCVNNVDYEAKPIDFVYVTENCITSDINIDRKITSLQSCQCEDKCGTNDCHCNNSSLQCWYDDQERLLTNFDYLDPPMIFECNQACSCNTITCKNRVVQRGLTQRFQLFRTESKGWGIRTLRFIQRGSYVCEYIGELISDMEADQREDDSYLFDLDSRVCTIGCGLAEKEGETYCIDARRYGNLARFINHHCAPNLLPVRIFINHHDLHFPRIAFFANRDIAADEELGFDYGEKFWIIKYKSFTCTCGALNCKYSESTIQNTLETYKLKISQEERIMQE